MAWANSFLPKSIANANGENGESSQKVEKEYDQGDHVDDIYNGIDLMKKEIIEKTKEKTVVSNLIKVQDANPSQIKQIGTDTTKLPLQIEIENPYRDAQILNEMAKATSKDEVRNYFPFLRIHDLWSTEYGLWRCCK